MGALDFSIIYHNISWNVHVYAELCMQTSALGEAPMPMQINSTQLIAECMINRYCKTASVMEVAVCSVCAKTTQAEEAHKPFSPIHLCLCQVHPC